MPGRPAKDGSCRVLNRIRELRFHRGEMTQRELAQAVGVSRQTIVAIEKASYAPSLELAFKIARVFGEPLESVFRFEEVDRAGEEGEGSKD